MLVTARVSSTLVQALVTWTGGAYLINKHVRAEVLEGKLELLEAVVDRDLDGDGGIRSGTVACVMAWSRHDGWCVEGL